MTREEAIDILNGERLVVWTEPEEECYARRQNEAIDIAIESLRADTVATIQTGQTYGRSAYIKELAEVVRCKDCKNWRESHSEELESYCYIDGRTTDSTGYCSWGERRE